MSRTVALTGATGFVGRAVARHLYAHGWNIKALIRTTSNTQVLQDIPIHGIKGSLTDAVGLATLLDDVTDVVHCAGVVRGASEAEFDATNYHGVTQLIRAASSVRNPPAILYVSSLAAREPRLSWYAASKYKAELALHSVSGEVNWQILRPPAIYGPGDKELRPLFRCMKYGFVPILGPSNARFSMIYVADIAAAIRHCLTDREATNHSVMELHDGCVGGYDWHEICAISERVFGRKIREIHMPETLLQGLAWSNLQLARMTGRSPMLTPGKVCEITHSDWVCNNDHINQITGWRPDVAFAEGLERTMAS